MTKELLKQEIQKERDCRYVIEKNAIRDRQLLVVALNLSRHRNELECQAVQIINKLGYIKALKISGVVK